MYKKYISNIVLSATFITLTACDAGGGFSDPGLETERNSNPIAQDFPIVYVLRPLPRNNEEDDPELGLRAHDITDPAAFNPGAKLIFKDRADANAFETVLTDNIFASNDYDVKDVTLSPDATKIAFAMHAPEDPNLDEDEQPTWNIWEYNIETEILSRVILLDETAEEGHDVAPTYLLNGDIVFSSTRQRRSKAILLDESKPQFSDTVEEDNEIEGFLLHVVNPVEAGEEQRINQITFNQSHDLYPTLLESGEIMFLRWDNYGQDRMSLYTVNPDGSDLTLRYGYHSPNTGTNNSEGAFNKPIQMPDGQILTNLRPRLAENLGGDMVQIDTQNFIDINRPTNGNTGAPGPAQSSLSISSVITDNSNPSPHGYFSSAYPMRDDTGRLLVSWSPCLVEGLRIGVYINNNGELVDEDGNFVSTNGDTVTSAQMANEGDIQGVPCTEGTLVNSQINLAEPQFGLWIYDPINRSQNPVLLARPGEMYTDAILVNKRDPLPDFIQSISSSLNSGEREGEIEQLLDENVGVLHIRSVYDFDGIDSTANGIISVADPAQTPPDGRPAYFIRFFKAVSVPHDDLFDLDFNLANGLPNRNLKDILGYAPVQPDGSVKVKLPADVAISFNILDINGRNISGPLGEEHQNWLTLRPGEKRNCNGCHTDDSEAPHGNLSAEPDSVNPGAGSIPNTTLTDRFGSPILSPTNGETMAEFYYSINLANALENNDDLAAAALAPSVDLIFSDVWSDESAGQTKANSFAYQYADLITQPPTLYPGCMDQWQALCRTIISYPDHIQPLWDTPRLVDNEGVMEDVTCINCHASTDPNGVTQIPAPGVDNQLDLSFVIENPQDDFPISYNDLFQAQPIQALCENGIFIDERRIATDADTPIAEEGQRFINPQFLLMPAEIDGTQQYEMEQLVIDDIPQFQANDPNLPPEQNPVPAPIDIELDPDSDLTLILDGGNPIPYLTNVLHEGETVTWLYYAQDACEIGGAEPTPEEITLNAGDPIPILIFRTDEFAQAIPRRVLTNNTTQPVVSGNGANASQRFFNAFATGGPHEGYLNNAELKLISEWLDIGGQFYNDPFDTLADD